MLSVQRFPLARFEDAVRDPSFQRLLEVGYRPVITIPVQDENRPPELFVVLVRGGELPQHGWAMALLVLLAVAQIATLITILVR